MFTAPPTPSPPRPCSPSPCGDNTYCRERGNTAVCECLPDHRGDPYQGCYPECIANTDCPNSQACFRHKCQDPCAGTCGINAVCTVSNHVPTCSCPYPMVGNAFTVCNLPAQPPPPDNPCVPNICGPQTTCENVNGQAICRCLPGLLGDPADVAGCHPECVLSSDCPGDRTCVNYKCRDPCLDNVCGSKAVCRAINHSPVCSCPPPLIGSPFVECYLEDTPDPCNPSPCSSNGECRVRNGAATCIYPECVVNSDCPRERACYSQKCRDPCIGACGINAVCRTINHNPVCSCPTGFMGNPHLECRDVPEPPPRPECTDNSDCPNDKTCYNQKCVSPCTLDTCGQNSQCYVQLHRAVCVCQEGYTGNPQQYCRELGCRSNDECPLTQSCINNECIDACLITQCGVNALCQVDGFHKARCYCQEGYFGNPNERCERPECTSDNECAYNLACRNNRCVSPCSCAPGAQCTVLNHRPSCRCPPGYTGDAYTQCVKEDEVIPECNVDADCPSKLACFNNFCKNPCIESQPCIRNAKCNVIDTLPMRTMICECPRDFIGDATKSCVRVDTSVDKLCQSNSECPSNMACLNRQCVSPCLANPCAHTAECRVENHRHICECAPGYVGNPYVDCSPDSIPQPNCKFNSECPSDKACINGVCQNPCMNNRCGLNAECITIQHHPTCRCQQGLAGNPQVQCFETECKADSDCPYDKTCRNSVCVTPCLTDNIVCGRGAECIAANHRAQCSCPPGTQGDARIACTMARCQYNEDCADHEICERFNRVCRPACDEKTCAENAICEARQHQPRCRCKIGTQGNPDIECIDSREKPRPECTEDSHCPASQACINAVCVDPCALSSMCSEEQECRVLGTVPVRTMICQCPPDTFIDINGKCKKIEYNPECKADDQCKDNEKCLKGTCIDACHITECGYNAQCKSSYHTGVCHCPADYTGNPRIECSIVPVIPPPVYPECYSNDDCSSDRQCINSLCANPCVSADACGLNALCHVDNHFAVCKCPTHYMGDAKIECIPPAIVAECQSNSDCAGTETCYNGLCVNPCNCGPNAKCTVTDHYPSCVCLPGYSGNPQIGCVQLECESDTDCSYSDTCYNNQCVSPCILENRCAINAECHGHNHRAQCRCRSGYVGNPELLCERVECVADYDCSSNLGCVNGHCVNPCLGESPCAQNAVCYVANHAAQCRCPENLPLGDPYSYCEPRSRPDAKECAKDSDCPTKRACVNARCVDPCQTIRPCLEGAHCSVLDTIPVRTMVCTCPTGWITDSEGICRPIQLINEGVCVTDDDCGERESCINRQCREPCSCGLNAVCHVKNHRAICSCEPGYEGNPEIACLSVECRSDSECASDKTCVNNNCVNPCLLTDVCGPRSECYVANHITHCRCRSGYHGDAQVSCHVIGCYSNSDCPSEHACINMQCVNPCLRDSKCSHRAECHVRNHLPVCRCPPNYRGNPYIACVPEEEPECREDGDCAPLLACFNKRCQNPCAVVEPCYEPSICKVLPSLPVRTMVCVCPSGYISSGSGTCQIIPPIVQVECTADSDCPVERACINAICRDPCACGTNAVCNVRDHKPTCSCLTGYDGNPDIECLPVGICRSNDECPGTHACIQRNCVPVCSPSLQACGEHAECVGIRHTAVCECPPGFSGNPSVRCAPIVGCRKDSECPSDKACINERCENPCTANPCDKDAECRVYNHVVECACPPGYVEAIEAEYPKCIPVGCRSDDECPSQEACINKKCVNPCTAIAPCGVNAICRVVDTHPVKTMTCDCLPDYRGNAVERCEPICQMEKGICRAKVIDDFKKSMSVKCLSDGVSVKLVGQGEAFNGIIYVKHYSSDEQCRRDLIFLKDQIVEEEFKVSFGTCGLTHVNGVASFTLVIQRHKKLMTYNAQAYSIKCLYQIGEQNITLGFNVSMMTTAGTIANTGPPPTCRMKIVSQSGNEISQAEIGDGLKLEVEVSPTNIYGGFARSCIAKAKENEVENEYVVTDENGCATDPSIFGEWEQDPETQTLSANFNAFKFPSSDNIRFQCNIRVCFGKCQPVNCRGYNAFGRRRRDTSSSNDTAISLPDNIIGDERGNINVTSNPIITIERQEDRYSLYQPNDPAPQRGSEDVCVSKVSVIISLIITALLALVAVAIAVSCWLMAYRRQPKTAGPLPHPPEFPNPLFTTESVAEPSPDYYLS